MTSAGCELDDWDNDDLLLATLEADEIIEARKHEGNTIPVSSVEVPDSFPFPFTPYDIQKDFMKNLYLCLELGKVGIFESPTGTGKSLSIICGALKWLRDFQEKQRKYLETLKSTDSVAVNTLTKPSSEKKEPELDWIHEFTVKLEQEALLSKLKNEQENIKKRETKLKELEQVGSKKRKFNAQLDSRFEDLMTDASEDIKRACKEELQALDAELNDSESGTHQDDEEIIVAEYNSEDENDGKAKASDCEDEEEHITKIYYCSRTHSQLSQFVKEVIKCPYENVRVISLGSRQNMCINPAVRKLSSLSLINDRCLELQQKKSKKKPGCPFYKQELLQTFKDKSLLKVVDIEQLVTTGREMKACPYYGSRLAVPPAEIVALPYNTLLHKSTRDACGIKLTGNVVVIDEAHNLLETINNIHSVEITAAQIVKAHSQLSQYEKKFKSRLTAKNLMYVRQILFVLSHLAAVLGAKVNSSVITQTGGKTEIKLQNLNDFLFESQLDNMNMFKLLRYCQRSRISKKLHGFVEKYQEAEVKTEESPCSGVSKFLQEINLLKGKQDNTNPQTSAVTSDHQQASYMSSPLMQIESFLEALTNADKDGRIVTHKEAVLSQSTLKFIMLNPAVHFISVLKEAKAVVVAGGTMQPVSEFKHQLFHAAGISPERILEFSCGHVIPGRQLLPLVVTRGPTGVTLDFTYQTRDKPHMVEELGRVITNICNVVPGGVVCFFPSYDYENLIYTYWEKNGTIGKIETKKKVFREPKKSGFVEQVLLEYSNCIKRCSSWQGSRTGALLMSVVGGKMSEGINFSDDMGRCVMMIGLPYPNINSPELKEKMAYLNSTFPKDEEGRLAGQVHYENLCMKAVNQSIGRAIRHKDDYAAILLLDQRYTKPSIYNKLPSWISQHLDKADNFSKVMQSLPKFFAPFKSTL
ncbi:ATP-dependent RNA helicase DDX11 [Biomphalaria glabrata]|uniref:ATP-dependent DNA helicase DDX11-like isoform X1 n=2 Tax=Biomphalaria glabrata TaxID=6526 RepID=A0A9W3B274_BIOGL|nr:ATP-dependent DNA helicase DDX11-like isoform X1 [Biomphalaria glabrata]XP_055893563.1 ATP-dependent DNA helicase DDX11-like isoform X1 [Biomphalaria glabrata]XP_055893564.1 ATP-dependent DNA helicase DDX11-like isoform X1 [Biomphalaria glabrata]KAI8756367.1 putative ATP-dependent RNA helicase DDX11 [Biomphalaria glabrata]